MDQKEPYQNYALLQHAHETLFPDRKLFRPLFRKAEDVLKEWETLRKLNRKLAAQCLIEIILYVHFHDKKQERKVFRDARRNFCSLFRVPCKILKEKEMFHVLEEVFVHMGVAKWRVVRLKIIEAFEKLKKENKNPKGEAPQT
jgi:hypothetical protein